MHGKIKMFLQNTTRIEVGEKEKKKIFIHPGEKISSPK